MSAIDGSAQFTCASLSGSSFDALWLVNGTHVNDGDFAERVVVSFTGGAGFLEVIHLTTTFNMTTIHCENAEDLQRSSETILMLQG